jgi:hypothetical protein
MNAIGKSSKYPSEDPEVQDNRISKDPSEPADTFQYKQIPPVLYVQLSFHLRYEYFGLAVVFRCVCNGQLIS